MQSVQTDVTFNFTSVHQQINQTKVKNTVGPINLYLPHKFYNQKN